MEPEPEEEESKAGARRLYITCGFMARLPSVLREKRLTSYGRSYGG